MCNMNKILEKAKELVAMLEEKEISDKVELSTVSPGCVIDLGEDEFVVLDHDDGGTLIISKGFMEENVKFGDNTDFNGSNVQRVLYEDILPKIEATVGKDNVLSQTVKLTTVDNQNIYEDVTGRIRLLTFDEVRKYNPLIVNKDLCICMESLGDKTFDSECNKWTSSNLRNYLNTEIYKKICEEIGEENVIEFERNLLSLDGQTEYGACKDFVSLISIDEYRTYRSLIPNFDEWWWMLSPYSTKCNEDSSYVSVVSPVGGINFGNYVNSIGVRPVCILKSNIFVSLGGKFDEK